MRRIAILITILCMAVAGCGDDTSAGVADNGGGGGGNGGGNGGNGGNDDIGSEPEPGPANEIDAEITADDGTTTPVSGSTEDVTPDANQAVVALGQLTVFLTSSDGALTTFDVEAPTDVIPGEVGITSDGGTGTWLTIASAEGIYTSAGGSITVNQCPEEGAVITGSFDVRLNDFFGEATRTLAGSWRATVAISDNSITCRVIEPDNGGDDAGGADAGGGDGGGGDDGGGGATCPNPTCDGPCCPLIEPVADCEQECAETVCDPLDPDFDFTGEECFNCQVACLDIFLDDAECGPVYEAALECEDDAGCLDLEDEEYEACVAEYCCEEDQAVF